MPLREGICSNSRCSLRGKPQEHYYHTSNQRPNPCDVCGGQTAFTISAFNIVFTGVLSARYNDRSIEGAQQEGHWFFERDRVTGKTTPVFIDTFDKQREVCKRTGTVNPKEMPRNWSVDANHQEVNTRGMPGTEI